MSAETNNQPSDVAFNALNRATWPDVLTAKEIGRIYRRSESGVKSACIRRKFVPMPFEAYPWRWRKSDVVRHLDSPTMPKMIMRGSSARKAG